MSDEVVSVDPVQQGSFLDGFRRISRDYQIIQDAPIVTPDVGCDGVGRPSRTFRRAEEGIKTTPLWNQTARSHLCKTASCVSITGGVFEDRYI